MKLGDLFHAGRPVSKDNTYGALLALGLIAAAGLRRRNGLIGVETIDQ